MICPYLYNLSIKLRAQALGVSRKGGTPVPIPNTAVKPFSADGSAACAVRE